jgi:hypothetical protein
VNQTSEFEVCLDQTPAPRPEVSEAERIAELLEQHGIDARRELVLDLEKILTRLSFKMAGEALRRFALRLPENSAAAVALRRVMLGPGEETTREAGRRCKVSHVAILKAEKRIRRWTGYQVRPL